MEFEKKYLQFRLRMMILELSKQFSEPSMSSYRREALDGTHAGSELKCPIFVLKSFNESSLFAKLFWKQFWIAKFN